MRFLATVFTLILALAACSPAAPNYESGDAPKTEVIEVVMWDESHSTPLGTALVPKWWASAYSEIYFFDGIYPPAGVDFDIHTARMAEGGEVFMLCLK
jgi:hypothetical protein